MSQRGSQETRSDGLSFFVQDQFTYNRLTFNVGPARRAVEAFRQHRRGDLHVRLGRGATAERGLRPPRRRQAEGLRLLRPLLRSDPQQHDQLRRHAERLRARGAGLDQRRLGHLPDARRPGAAGRVLRAVDQDAVYRRRERGLPGRPRQEHEPRSGLHESAHARHPRGLRPRALRLLRRTGRPTIPDRSTIPSRCGWASTTSATRRIRDRTSSSRRSTAASGTIRASTWSSASATATTGSCSGPTPTTGRRATRTRTRTQTSRATCSIWIRWRPNTYKKQPGTIPHVFKAAGSYIWPVGIELGAAFRYNSGTIASRTALASQRNLPIQVDVPYTSTPASPTSG